MIELYRDNEDEDEEAIRSDPTMIIYVGDM